MKYRSRTEIIHDILHTVRNDGNGVVKTKIMYSAFLSYHQVNEYLAMLIDNGLLKGKTPEDGGYVPVSTFTIPVFCPRRDLLMADKGLAKMYIDFINTLAEEVSEMKGQPAAIASSYNDYYQLEQVQFMGGPQKYSIHSFEYDSFENIYREP